MSDLRIQIPHRDGHGGFRTYFQQADGGFRDEYGTSWSPPIRSIPKTWQKMPAFQAFENAILASRDRLEWRTQTRHRRVERLTAYYPGFTPADRAALPDCRLYIDVDAGDLFGLTITWYCCHGKYTFTADRDQPEAAVQVLELAMERLLAAGNELEETGNAPFAGALQPSLDLVC